MGKAFPSSWYQIFSCSFLLSVPAGVLGLWTAIPPRLSPVFGAEPGYLSQAWDFLHGPGLVGSGCGEHSHRHPTGGITTFWSLPPGSPLTWLVVSRPLSSCPGVSLRPRPSLGQQMRVGPPQEEELLLSWAGLGWERPGRLHCSDGTFSPSSPLHQQPWSLPGSGGLRGDHRWWMGKH